ncbi:class I SAM-dependent methyltransferase [Desertihabitans brevis]|uniref:Class I SAM-dependent methyltransferase n=1 Tax=Desertihabitans brevis TaxID=2268447 RepID=A0A367YVF8_9ACTN|nr:class I SAM-dependent methyltransferase [Desertihabitans brevis]RCK69865.1 class I SAM-dependent methyltransferase [Desertihabitans brevis]
MTSAQRVSLHGEQLTMLGTLAGRALDAGLDEPVLGDRWAAEALARVEADVDRLGVDADLALSIALRARLVDRWCRPFLDEHPDAVVLHLGCGLDTRYQRLQPGPDVDWYEVDQPDVMAVRASVLPPAGERQHSIVADVTGREWLDEVPYGRPTLVVAEGLTMYLRPETGAALLTRLSDRFGRQGPGGEAVFDTYSSLGIRLQWLNRVVRRSRAVLGWGIDDPYALEALGMTLLQVAGVEDMVTEDVRDRLSPKMRRQLKVALAVPAFRTMGRVLRYRL